MKYLSIVLFISISTLVFAQDLLHPIHLNWQTSENGFDTFDGAIVDEKSGLPHLVIKKQLKSGQSIIASLSNITTQILPSSPNETELPLDFEISTWTETDRKATIGFISITCVRGGRGFSERLKSGNLWISIKDGGRIGLRGGGGKTESVLKDGSVYKLSIPNNGIYSLSGAFIRDQIGVNLSDIDVDRINVYGNEGGRIPESNLTPRTDDLEQLPCLSIGLEDGVFNEADRLIFYAHGPHAWTKSGQQWELETNIYDDNNYVFVKLDGEPRKEINIEPSIDVADHRTSYIEREYYGKDDLNLLGRSISHQGSGKIWMSDEISNSREIDLSNSFHFGEAILGSTFSVKCHFYGRAESRTTYELEIGSHTLTKNISGTDFDPESTYAKKGFIQESLIKQSPSSAIKVMYPPQSVPSEGWLDFVNVNYRRAFPQVVNQHILMDTFSLGEGGYEIGVANGDWHVWNVSSIHDSYSIDAEKQSSTLRFGLSNANEAEICVFDLNSNLPSPGFVEELDNQNLHAVDDVDMIILSPQVFSEEAHRLAQHRKEQSQLAIQVIDVDKIYNEFSSGRQDPGAIRDFCKMILDRNDRFKYLLLFGDGSYDWRHTVKSHEDQNFVPAYQTDESLAPIYAFPSDDFYALLSDDEGEGLSGSLDIAVGRLLCRSVEEAQVLVDKIIRYEAGQQTFGDWRNRLLYLADDEDSNRHIDDVDGIAVDIEEEYPAFNQNKIYFDAYEQESTPGGNRYPDAKKDINNSIFKGQLLMVYLGHGGPTGLAQERVLQSTDIRSWSNYYQLPVIMTATCSFTGFDEPGMTTAGEYSVLNPNGGAIAMLSTVRAVYASDNAALTRAVHQFIFDKENGKALPLGEVMRRAKNSTKGSADESNNRKFSLFGDPSMPIALPTYDVTTTEINGIDATEFTDTIGALQTVTIKGHITDHLGEVVTDFNGMLSPTVFDKPLSLKTKANDPRSRVKEFSLRKNVIYKGSTPVTNGEFEFSFIVPKDINFEVGLGKISYYAFDLVNRDASGYFDQITIGGSSNGSINDDTPPVVKVYMNNEDFIYGGKTNDSPTLLILLSDDTGINVVGNSIGHDLTAVLDENTQDVFILNDFYEADVNDNKQGVVRYPLSNLEVGRHKIKVTAWDIANNFSEGFTEFVVVDDAGASLSHIFNYPNPFSGETTFRFDHNLPAGPMNIRVEIYTLPGQRIKTIQHSTVSDGFRVDDINWNGTSDSGMPLTKGVYVYKIIAEVSVSGTDLKKESEFERLVIVK